ncbi:hypothetical protein, partial [Micromonospora sagamiensis]
TGRFHEGRYLVSTDAGMCGLWQPEHFTHVGSLEAWEDNVSNPAALGGHIRAGAFVPLNVGGDGAFQVTVRVGERTAREERYTLVSSEPYLLVSASVLALGGLEQVGTYGGGAEEISLPSGRYVARVHLLDWKAEPGSTTEDGAPAEYALPDFIVEIHPEVRQADAYRTNVETFERPQ